jgi:hypothetical protein
MRYTQNYNDRGYDLALFESIAVNIAWWTSSSRRCLILLSMHHACMCLSDFNVDTGIAG